MDALLLIGFFLLIGWVSRDERPNVIRDRWDWTKVPKKAWVYKILNKDGTEGTMHLFNEKYNPEDFLSEGVSIISYEGEYVYGHKNKWEKVDE